jgi:hypothetical protein
LPELAAPGEPSFLFGHEKTRLSAGGLGAFSVMAWD